MAGAQRVGAGQGRSDAPRGRTIALGGRPRGGLAVGDAELDASGTAPFGRSRFLKVRAASAAGGQRRWAGSAAQAARGEVPPRAAGSAAHARSNSALRKVAQLENRFVTRKKQSTTQKHNSGSGQEALGEESFSSAAPHEHSARGKKYLKSDAAARAKEEENGQSPKKKFPFKAQLGLDSDEEELRELMESPLHFSSGKEDWKVAKTDPKQGAKAPISPGTPPSPKAVSPAELSTASSFHSRDSDVFGGGSSPAPSSASRNHSVPRHTGALPRPLTKDKAVKVTQPATGHPRHSQRSLEGDGSAVESLDELFSEAADSRSSSSNDFRPNILSLDDLAPAIPSEAAVEQESTNVQMAEESKRNPSKDTFLVEKDQPSLKRSAALALSGVHGDSEGEPGTEEEISEHCSDVSAEFSGHSPHGEGTISPDYSEDFEVSSSTAGRELVTQAPEGSESRGGSGKHPPPGESIGSSGKHPPPCSSRRQRRAALREAAVQTVEPPPPHCCSQTHTSAVLDQPLGNTYFDPVPVASHVISKDALEALTAHSPTLLVLNDMFKQHLMLTQQFIETVHHLHSSLVESLEAEQFHYHTLEEAKEYIRNHRSPPLTLKQARKEIEKAEEEKWV